MRIFHPSFLFFSFTNLSEIYYCVEVIILVAALSSISIRDLIPSSLLSVDFITWSPKVRSLFDKTCRKYLSSTASSVVWQFLGNLSVTFNHLSLLLTTRGYFLGCLASKKSEMVFGASFSFDSSSFRVMFWRHNSTLVTFSHWTATQFFHCVLLCKKLLI